MIEIDESGAALRLSFGGKRLLEHSARAPCLALGEGVPSYRMRYSNFKIRERVTRKAFAGPWEIRSATPARVIVAFPGLVTVTFAEEDGALVIRFAPERARDNRLWLSLAATPGEHIYGCGEQFSALDLRGRRVPLWVQEQGVGRGKDLITWLADLHSGSGGAWHTTYFAQPTFVSSANYSCHIDCSAYAELDFRASDRHTLYLWQVPAQVRIDVADTAPAVIGRLSAFLGRQPELPAWAYAGLWLGVQGGAPVVEEKLRRARAAGVPVAAVWAQDWEGIRLTSFGKQLLWNWRYDRSLYPDLPAYIKRLGEQGVRFLGYINPMLVPEGDLYREAAARGYLVKDAAGAIRHVYITSFPAALIDLDNPDAARWYKGILKDNLIGIGMAGWMADFGEALPTDAVLASGRGGAEAHNEYPVQWARVNREAVEEAGKLGEVVFFMRAGAAGSSRAALAHWAGDQLVNWSLDDGFATVIPAALSLGFCGIGHFHSDIGGYTTVAWIKRDKELLLRWCEQAAFTPIMRTHEGNRPQDNWQFDADEETLAHFARMARVYVHLGDYHRALGREYVETGVPPMRHPYVHYEGDEALHALRHQYLYGRDLLVAPVIRPRERSMRVYLPEDTWIHAWTGRAHGRGWHEVAAQIGEPPVFYRASSPFRALFDGLREAGALDTDERRSP
jgi:alpha-glucosidase